MYENQTPSLEHLLSHRRWVQGVARRLLRDEQAAEDLAQETWVRAMRSPPDPARDPKPWLRRVLKNLASNTRRGEGRRQKHEDAWRPSRESRSPEALVAEAEQHTRLVNLLMDLEEPFKTALVMRFYEGLGPKEIAERLDVPVGTVHSRIARAVERMKTRLDGEENGNRNAWIAGLLPLAGLDLHAPAVAATATTTSLAGILVMTFSKPKFALLLALLTGCLVGGGIWLAGDSLGDDPDAQTIPDFLTSDALPTLEGQDTAQTADAEAETRPVTGSERASSVGTLSAVLGSVRDAAGHPVAGAEVFVLPKGAPGVDAEDFERPRHSRTHTAADGTFEVRLGTSHPARLLAFAKGHTSGSVVLADPTSSERVELALGEPWHLRVQVADAAGNWPADCEVNLLDRAIDPIDRAVDPKRQALDIELAAPASGNVHDVALHRTGSVWMFVSAPRGMAAVPAKVELTQPTDEVSIRLVPSVELTVRLRDASTNEPLAADTRVVGWMGQSEVGVTTWSFGARGPIHTRRTNIAPQTYDLEFNVPGFEQWKGQITFQTEGEARTLEIRLEPQKQGVATGRLLLDVSANSTSPKALLQFAHLSEPVHKTTEPYEMFARMREGDLDEWNQTWSASGGWADLNTTTHEDGSIEISQELYGVMGEVMPAGSYDIYIAERATGRAAFLSAARVFGDQINRYAVQLEPGTMLSIAAVLPADDVFTDLEVRTDKTGSLPLVALHRDGSQTFNTSTSLEYLLRVPRKPIRLGPFPADSVSIRFVDADGRAHSMTVSGAGHVER